MQRVTKSQKENKYKYVVCVLIRIASGLHLWQPLLAQVQVSVFTTIK